MTDIHKLVLAYMSAVEDMVFNEYELLSWLIVDQKHTLLSYGLDDPNLLRNYGFYDTI